VLCSFLKFDMNRFVNDADASLCQRGLRTNILYGDYVEACYPFMEQSTITNAGGYLASGLSSAWLVASKDPTLPKSLAYLPFPLSIALARHEWQRMLVASSIAFTVSFVAAFASPLVASRKRKIT